MIDFTEELGIANSKFDSMAFSCLSSSLKTDIENGDVEVVKIIKDNLQSYENTFIALYTDGKVRIWSTLTQLLLREVDIVDYIVDIGMSDSTLLMESESGELYQLEPGFEKVYPYEGALENECDSKKYETMFELS